jgi:hypothetical protein
MEIVVLSQIRERRLNFRTEPFAAHRYSRRTLPFWRGIDIP